MWGYDTRASRSSSAVMARAARASKWRAVQYMYTDYAQGYHLLKTATDVDCILVRYTRCNM